MDSVGPLVILGVAPTKLIKTEQQKINEPRKGSRP